MSTNATQICKVGQSFKEILYIASVNEGFRIELEDEFGHLITILKPGSWIGVVEHSKKEMIEKHPELSELVKTNKMELVWGISAIIKKNNKDQEKIEEMKEFNIKEDNNINQLNIFLSKKQSGCVVYRFDLNVNF